MKKKNTEKEQVDYNIEFVDDNANHSFLSSSGPGPGPRSGPDPVPGQVQKVQGLRTKDLNLG